jgi:putative transposase
MTRAARWHAHRHTGGRGHLYQSRFKSFAIQQDGHFLSVCRYVERNALRTKLVERAERWPWCSAWTRGHPENPLHGKLSPWPLDMPSDWLKLLNDPQTEAELAAVHLARDRGRPYGDARWMAKTAKRLGVESSLRPVGRPKGPFAGERTMAT